MMFLLALARAWIALLVKVSDREPALASLDRLI
jgi:hypothetical protein